MQRLLIISRVVAAVSLQSKAPKAIINRGQLKSSFAPYYWKCCNSLIMLS